MELVKQNLKVKSDKMLSIATAPTRLSTKWTNQEISWQTLVDRLKTPTKTQETVAEYQKMSASQRGKVKDVGGFVGGFLKSGRRKAENVANRSMITLDMDFIPTTVEDVWESITMLYGCEMCIYSTHSHTKHSPRLRIIIPLDRAVYPDEYQAIGRKMASDFGMDMFDDTTYEPSRLMYWPSVSIDGEYVFLHSSGDFLNADEILDTYLDWRDVTTWSISSRAHEAVKREIKKQEDPLEKEGLIGAFCRTYTIHDVIDKYLSDIYDSTSSPDRYTYHKGSTVAGLVVYEDKFAFSHHGTDPISGMLVNAFDLVRVHLYGDMDEDATIDTPANRLPSFQKMTRVAMEDDKVKKLLGLEKLKEAEDDFEFEDEDLEWLEKLSYNKKGVIENTIDNALLILSNDPKIKGKLVYNEFANRAIVKDDVPWTNRPEHDWSDMDDSGIRHFLEDKYQITTAYKIEDAKNLTFDRNKYHPVRDYLKGLKWDGQKRLETIFIDYLGAEDNIYTRDVAKVQFLGAVSRIMRPGVKFDTMATLCGPQGIGKSTFINKISKGWYSDSLDTMRGKEAMELIQGVWHIELGELNATKKSDIDTVKSFLSRQHDIYRVAYAKNTTRFPRQCVFWGSTNDVDFLRDPTGDRRTYPVVCNVTPPIFSVWEDLTDEVVDQLWAETVELYNSGDSLILKGKSAELAKKIQSEHKEDVPLKGLIEEYLNRDFPANWEELDLADRIGFLRGDADTFAGAPLTYKKDRVCVLEIWCELLNKRPGDLKPINSREINTILRSLDGWENTSGPIQFGKIYGKQRGYTKN